MCVRLVKVGNRVRERTKGVAVARQEGRDGIVDDTADDGIVAELHKQGGGAIMPRFAGPL